MGKDRVKKGPGADRVAKKCGCPATLCPQKFWGFFPKFPCKSLNSFLSLILEIWKENFEKKNLKKGNPNLGKTMLFRSYNLWM
jgi:hypothetical protein